MDPQITQVIKDELKNGIEQIQKSAVELVPVDTGDAKRALQSKQAIGVKSNGFRVEFGLRTKRLAREAFYLHFVEYGTKGGTIKSGPGAGRIIPPMKARPFLKPALDKNKSKIRRDRARAINRALKRVAKGA